MRYLSMSQPPAWIPNRPIGNQYIFRDTAAKIIRTYNMNPNEDSLEFFLQKAPFINRNDNFTVVSLLNSTNYYESAYHPYLKKIFNCNVLSFDYNDSIHRKKLKTGLMDTLGNVVIPVEYEELIFANTLIIAMKNKRYGLLDSTGENTCSG